MDELRCTKCGVAKLRAEFWVHKRRSTGHQGECKDCIRGRDAKRRKTALGLPDLRRKYPPVCVDSEGRALCVTCGLLFVRSSSKRRCAPCARKRRDLEADATYHSVYRHANKQHLNEARKYARLANPAKLKVGRAERRVAIAERSDGTLSASVIRQLFAKHDRCVYCSERMGEAEKTLDHLVPIASGGCHTAANVTVCCNACNSSKQALPFDAWTDRLRHRFGEMAASRAERLFRRATKATPQQVPMTLIFVPRVQYERRSAKG